MRALLFGLIVAWSACFAPSVTASSTVGQGAAFDAGVEAYRAGDHAQAIELWEEALEAPLAAGDRARVLYNLGNAAWRQSADGAAIGWYSACLALEPRHADARANLAYVREELGLPPDDAGGLYQALIEGLELWTRAEAALAVLATSLLLFVCLLFEALRGGRVARVGVGLAAFGVALSLAPWIQAEMHADEEPWVAIGTPEVSLRAEPSGDRPAIATLEPGERVEVIDELGTWRRVSTDDGTRAWCEADELFELGR